VDSQVTPGPLSHLALPPRESYAEEHITVMSSASLSRQIFNRQVFRPYNPFKFAPMPAVVPMTRLAHIQIVIQAAQELAYELGLNYEVVSAGAYAHDCGQICKGHYAEKWLSQKSGRVFKHENFGLVSLCKMEKISLSPVVEQCVAWHSLDADVMTRSDVSEEVRAVALGDKLAYLAFDPYDILQYLQFGALTLTGDAIDQKEMYRELEDMLRQIYPHYVSPNRATMGITGISHQCFQALHHLLDAAVEESIEMGKVSFQHSDTAQKVWQLRNWLYANIYKRVDDTKKESRELETTFSYLAYAFTEYDTWTLMTLVNDLDFRRLVSALDLDNKSELMDTQFDIVAAIYRFNIPKINEGEIDIFAIPEWVKQST